MTTRLTFRKADKDDALAMGQLCAINTPDVTSVEGTALAKKQRLEKEIADPAKLLLVACKGKDVIAYAKFVATDDKQKIKEMYSKPLGSGDAADTLIQQFKNKAAVISFKEQSAKVTVNAAPHTEFHGRLQNKDAGKPRTGIAITDNFAVVYPVPAAIPEALRA